MAKNIKKDWVGSKNSVFTTLGASNHTTDERAELDFYATSPEAVKKFYNTYWNELGMSTFLWECACGNGHIVKALKELNPNLNIKSSDIVKRDFECEIIDFLKVQLHNCEIDIITNPPYIQAMEFCKKAIDIIANNRKVLMFLKITFLESKKRKHFFETYPPKYVMVFSDRVSAAKNGDEKKFKTDNAACYAWFVWEKGFQGSTVIKWI